MKTRKGKVKLGLHGLTDYQKTQKGTNIVTAMTGNPDFQPPPPDLALLVQQKTEANNAIHKCRVLLSQYKAALSEKDTAVATMCDTMTRLGNYVENLSGGKPVGIHSAGMQVRNDRTPVHMSQVQKLRVTRSEKDGELLVRWKRIRGARVYEVQICRQPLPTQTNWEYKLTATKAKCALNHDLVSGEKVWVRVRAVGTNDVGAWSNVGVKTVP
jgi:hypothetical protein